MLGMLILVMACVVFYLGTDAPSATNEYYFIAAALLFITSCVASYKPSLKVLKPTFMSLASFVLSILMGLLSIWAVLISWGVPKLGGGSWGAWGRPLRLRKKITHAGFIEGKTWSRGPQPNCSSLDPITRKALAQLWYFDAKKEHASVPAFARLVWIMTALGAPAKILEKLHHCGLQEIEHTRRTLALANAYADTEMSFDALPEMLEEKMISSSDPLATLAEESLLDGCLVEEYNADVAEEALKQVEDPAVESIVKAIVREERFHAAVAWEILEWCLLKGGESVRQTLQKAMRALPEVGSFCYSEETLALYRQANPDLLRRHGRVGMDLWQPLYQRRLEILRGKIEEMLKESGKRLLHQAA